MRNDMESKPELNNAVGEWKLGDGDNFISFALSDKPNFFRRFWGWAFFGLKWVSFKVPKPNSEVLPSKGIRSSVTKVISKGRR